MEVAVVEVEQRPLEGPGRRLLLRQDLGEPAAVGEAVGHRAGAVVGHRPHLAERLHHRTGGSAFGQRAVLGGRGPVARDRRERPGAGDEVDGGGGHRRRPTRRTPPSAARRAAPRRRRASSARRWPARSTTGTGRYRAAGTCLRAARPPTPSTRCTGADGAPPTAEQHEHAEIAGTSEAVTANG